MATKTETDLVREKYVKFQAPYDRASLAFYRLGLAADRMFASVQSSNRLARAERNRLEERARGLEEKLALAGIEA